ncbi:MAG: class II glutamine amidotransferase [Muribaculaceae bacterium]
MCELLGLSSRNKITVNNYLREFFSHSDRHCHGWGLALFYGDAVSLEKEATCANRSLYLRQRIAHPILIDNMVAHIRLASVGRMVYENCHPFVKHDSSERSWTLAHNGTIFSSAQLDAFKTVQEGQTDSERILYYFIDEINKQQHKLGWQLTPEERFRLFDRLITELSVGNKLNLLMWDGEYMYVHSNYRDSLHVLRKDVDTVWFSTQPIGDGDWQPVPFLQLLVYRCGRLVYQGCGGSQEYFDPEENYEYKNFDYANL